MSSAWYNLARLLGPITCFRGTVNEISFSTAVGSLTQMDIKRLFKTLQCDR
jgi:hypothetical protein